MDVNLTDPIATNVTLTQSLWIPALNLFAGLIGALIGAAAIYFVAHYEKEQDTKKLRREERKQAYINYISVIFYIHQHLKLGKSSEHDDLRDFFKFAGEVKLLGSPEIIRNMIIANPQDLADTQRMNAYGDNLVRLMAKEIQDFDVYEKVFPASKCRNK
jgi:hypothetical protein